tara:strand:+ start:87 stop:731 length:645 start_codon:yes stop_codon:yes gene_type:complete
MDEEIAIINSKTRTDKIKNFLIENKKKIIFFLSSIILLIIIFFGSKEYNVIKKIKIANFYNSTIIKHSEKNKVITIDNLISIINEEDATYSPLSLFFIIDNNLILDKGKVNNLFDLLIHETPLENEIRNLITYKKALYNVDNINEKDLLDILNPLMNSKSVWKSHALYLIAEYFYAKNENQKSKEFFSLILNLENSNPDIRIEAQKRLNRDLSD